jgi:copper chaperone CopZ
MKVELFYFDGCPNHVPALQRLRQILQQEGRPEHVEEINVTSPEQAQALGFLGSPTIKINGVDVEPEARDSEAYAMACRTYRNAGKQEGQPSAEIIRAAVREAAAGQSPDAHDCCAPKVPAVAAKNGASKSSAVVMAGSIFAAILASFCCILPIVFGLTGLTVIGASAAFAAWRPYLLTATLGLLAAGFYFAYRPSKAACAPGRACAMPNSKRSGRLVLWLTTAAVVAFALFPYYSGPVAELLLPDQTAHPASSAPVLRHASFSIEGMDCAACATAVQGKLKSVAGVQAVRVSFEQKLAEVDYNPAVASPEQFQKAIEDAGYRAVKTNKGA